MYNLIFVKTKKSLMWLFNSFAIYVRREKRTEICSKHLFEQRETTYVTIKREGSSSRERHQCHKFPFSFFFFCLSCSCRSKRLLRLRRCVVRECMDICSDMCVCVRLFLNGFKHFQLCDLHVTSICAFKYTKATFFILTRTLNPSGWSFFVCFFGKGANWLSWWRLHLLATLWGTPAQSATGELDQKSSFEKKVHHVQLTKGFHRRGYFNFFCGCRLAWCITDRAYVSVNQKYLF